MKIRPASIAVITLFVATAQMASGQQPAAALSAQQLAPVSWSCPMHADVVDEQEGTCPICHMTLVAVRLVSVWTCPVHAVIDEDMPGKCRICSRALVPATR